VGMNHGMKVFGHLHNDGFTVLNAELYNKQLIEIIIKQALSSYIFIVCKIFIKLLINFSSEVQNCHF
jgi:hypothetical protein